MAEVALIEDLIWQEVEDGMILLHVADGRYFELNAVAATIIRALRETGCEKATLQQVVDEYDVSMDVAKKDLQALLVELRLRNWLC